MEALKYPALFEPFSIGSCEVKNRIVMSAMDTKHEKRIISGLTRPSTIT